MSQVNFYLQKFVVDVINLIYRVNRKLKKELIEWVVFFSIIGILFMTGLHTTVFGTLQRGLLATGILRPNLEAEPIPANYDMILLDEYGNEVDVGDWKSRTIFMNYWATWCAPCIAEMPDINKLYNEVSPDVTFAIISVDDNRQKAIDFVRKKEFDFPIYFLKTRRPDVYQSQSIPTTYVISPDGKIVVKNKGMAQYSNNEFVDFLRNL